MGLFNQNTQHAESSKYKQENHSSDIVGIGSPLLDFTVEAPESLLEEMELKKGQMHLIDQEKSRAIFKRLDGYKITKTPGGSAANTLAGIANLGGRCVLFGKIGNDPNGDIYKLESERAGVKTRLNKHENITGHAITFITTDSERTFATHLGAALHFQKEDVIDDDIRNCKILHIEGYLMELPELREATIHAMQIAKKNGVKISIDLADPGLISRIYQILHKIVNEYCDIVFVNEEEAQAFTGKDKVDALNIIYSMCDVAVVKLGENGSLIKANDTIHSIPVYKTNVVNTNGAGDMYAAGVLYGIANNIPFEKAGRIGSYTSSLVVSQVGARLNEKIAIDKI